MLYRSYRHFWRNSREFHTRCTPVGWILLSTLLLSAFVGLDTNHSMAFQLFTLIAALILTGILSTIAFQPRIRIGRDVPTYASAGSPFTYTVDVSNEGQALKGIQLLERLPDPIPGIEQFVKSREPGEETRNAFDQRFAYYRWLWLINHNELARSYPGPAFDLQRSGSRTITMTLTPKRRGVIQLDRMRVLQPDPFGFIKAARGTRVEGVETVTVLPRRYPLPVLEPTGPSRYQPRGENHAGHIGQTEEYMGLREYRRGDPMRHIHWKSWARLGAPIVKEFEDEYYARYALILDTFGREEEGSLFEEAVSIAASFACTLDTKESLLDLMFVGSQAYCYTSGRGNARPRYLLEILAAVELCHEDSFDTLHNLVASRCRALSSCICVLVEWNEERRVLLRTLRLHGLDVTALLVRPPKATGPMPTSSDFVHIIDPDAVAEGLARL